jgi:ACS family hexuronate transporter-like MFS transporter
VQAIARPGTTEAKAAPQFSDPRLWGFMLVYALGALPIGFVLYQAAIYLNQSWGMTQADVGKVLWIPPVGWELGYFFWGWLADRMSRRAADPLRPLRLLMGIAMLLSLTLALTPWSPRLSVVLFELFLAMFVAGGFIILAMAYATRTFAAAHSGLIAGLGAGAWSGVVGILMPLFGRLFDLHLSSVAFVLAAACPVLGYGLWLWACRRGRDFAEQAANPAL